jgi:hypothetical protein
MKEVAGQIRSLSLGDLVGVDWFDASIDKALVVVCVVVMFLFAIGAFSSACLVRRTSTSSLPRTASATATPCTT